MQFSGFLPLKTELSIINQFIRYRIGDFDLNDAIGKTISMTFTGKTKCVHCGALDVELEAGYCSSCMSHVAKCDICMVLPDRCHYAQGTCREPSWGEANCMTPHIVYLSNTSGLKIGITRENNAQDLSRWIDQGATQALPILRVANRLTAGQIEAAISEVMADKTNWRTMLTCNGALLDLKAVAAALIDQFKEKLALYGDNVLDVLDADVISLNFPVQVFPDKIGNAWNVGKKPVLTGVLVGIKGQFIMVSVDHKIEVLKLRKYAGYDVNLQIIE